MAAVGLAEAGLIKEAIQVADSVVGELARPNTMTAVGTTFLWMDKFGPALQVGALAGNFHLIVEVAKRAADLGLPEWVAQAMCLVDHPTFRLGFNDSYAVALRNEGNSRTGAPTATWDLPEFVNSRTGRWSCASMRRARPRRSTAPKCFRRAGNRGSAVR